MRIAVTHVTRMEFGAEVTDSVMDARLGPRDDADQRVQHFRVKLEPAGHVHRYEDGFGNVAHLLTSVRPHTFLQVTAESQVQTYLSDPFAVPHDPPHALDPIERVEYLSASPLIPRTPFVDEMAAPFRSNDTFEAVRRMGEFIHTEFTYRQNVTDVTTSIEQVVAGRQGVCQDFAHLLIGMCRAIDIPARYVSGYIVARSMSADDHVPSRGDGASHAWAEAFTLAHGWRGFDPTNNLVANEHYVKVAIGRDYRDVPPTRGTYHGVAADKLTVAVNTRALD